MGNGTYLRHAYIDRSAAERRSRTRLPVSAQIAQRLAAAVAQGRADWGVMSDSVARQYGLGFIPLQDEHYDFVVPKAHLRTLACMEP